jgi:hypothetical protein
MVSCASWIFITQITNAGLERLKAMKHLAALDLRYTRYSGRYRFLRGELPACRVTFLDSSVERQQAGGGRRPLDWVSSLGGKIALENGRVGKSR